MATKFVAEPDLQCWP